MTEIYLIIDGQKVPVPRHPHEASDMGWHLGVEYNSALNWQENDFLSILDWCKATFDPHVYRMFMRTVWFLREEDATLCRLKWA